MKPKSFRHYWMKFLQCLFKPEKNIVKNKYDILNLLFTSENTPMETKESIELFTEIRSEFEAVLTKRAIDSRIIVADVEEYFNKLNKPQNEQ